MRASKKSQKKLFWNRADAASLVSPVVTPKPFYHRTSLTIPVPFYGTNILKDWHYISNENCLGFWESVSGLSQRYIFLYNTVFQFLSLTIADYSILCWQVHVSKLLHHTALTRTRKCLLQFRWLRLESYKSSPYSLWAEFYSLFTAFDLFSSRCFQY